ncbi:MAG: GNAT family N-acetyltransferase [Acidimicrobiales bacterium]
MGGDEGSDDAGTVEEVRAVDDELMVAMRRLVPQLSSSAPEVTLAHLEGLVRTPATTLLVARDTGGAIVGSLTLAMFRIPSGLRAWIEDVVVDGRVRGKGVGAALVGSALGIARGAGARTVDLTSRPERESANRLYVRLGFAPRPTNVYRHQLV